MGQYLKQDESGLSLIELLISLGICVTALMGLAQVLAIGVAANSQSLARSKATSLAKFQLEALKAVPFDDAQLAAGGITPARRFGRELRGPGRHRRPGRGGPEHPHPAMGNRRRRAQSQADHGGHDPERAGDGTRITIQLTTLRTRG